MLNSYPGAGQVKEYSICFAVEILAEVVGENIPVLYLWDDFLGYKSHIRRLNTLVTLRLLLENKVAKKFSYVLTVTKSANP